MTLALSSEEVVSPAEPAASDAEGAENAARLLGAEAGEPVAVDGSRAFARPRAALIALLSVAALLGVARLQQGSRHRSAFRGPDLGSFLSGASEKYIDGNVNCGLSRCELENAYLTSEGYTCSEDGLDLGSNCGDRGCTNSKGKANCYVLDPAPHLVTLAKLPTLFEWKCPDGYQNEAGFCIACSDYGLKNSTFPGKCAAANQPSCFPGDSVVMVEGDAKPRSLAGLRVGDRVLADIGAGRVAYEPVLSFLHVVPGKEDEVAALVAVRHAAGDKELRATPGHLVFSSTTGRPGSWSARPAAQLRVGDFVRVVGDAFQPQLGPVEAVASRVLSVRSVSSAATVGLYAPLTPSGTIVVDGAVASNYATPSEAFLLPHPVAHAVFFFHRAYYYLFGVASLDSKMEVERMDPLAARLLPMTGVKVR